MVADGPIVVFGAGAVGSYLGARLALSEDSSSEVTLVGRGPLVETVNSHGLVLQDGGHELVSRPVVTESTGDAGTARLIILTVKGYDVQASIPSLRSLATDNSLILAMQNGVGSEEFLLEAFGPERVLVGTITASVSMDETGIVVRNGKKGGLALGSANRSTVPEWVVQRFRAAALPPLLVDDYRSVRWSKLLLNLPGTATTAILDCDMETVMNNPALFRVEQMAFREAMKVIDKLKIRVVSLPDYSAPLIARVMSTPAGMARRLLAPRLIRSRDGRAPSMRRDLSRGRTEIDFLNGAVAREAKRAETDAPVNATLTDLIKEISTQPDLRSRFRQCPEELLTYLVERGGLRM